MFRPAAAIAGFVVVATGPVGPAHADEFSLHTILSSYAGVTTNAFSTPDGGTMSSDPSLNYNVRPGVLFSYHTQRALHELSADAGLDGNDFTSNLTFTYDAGYRTTYSLTPRTEGEAGLTLSGGRVNALATFQSAPTGPTARPTGQVDFIQAQGSEAISYQWSPDLTLRETVFGRYLATNNHDEVPDPPPPPPATVPFDTSGWDAGIQVSGDRTFRVTQLSVQLQTSFQRLGVELPAGSGMVVDRDQLDARGTLRLRRDFSEKWSGGIEGGMVALIPLEEGDQLVYQPLGVIDVAYVPAWGATSLAVRHDVSPNLFLAQNQISDSVTLNALVPLSVLGTRASPKLNVAGAIGLSHSRFLDLSDGSTLSAFNVFSGDVALNYSPRESMQVGLRYQLVRQGDTDMASPDPMLAQLAYTRHTVLVTFYARWPARVAAEIPSHSRLRVNDLQSVGDESSSSINGTTR